ncbi:Plasmodium exported protein, unknown function [Plasmodium relictum]|uniref:Uncharacterized protein n=1 Tax=Plasmodium relictum TaxID=85471 RepID=A0A1J1GK07_PLARL|nr:Plasmodium exported protein, unknown function [Plasmodium relictum]CRG84468.1 Plasmodium exported protein, unknown function [Plasmodium relictum]
MISCDISDTPLISRNVILNRNMNNLFGDSNNVSKNRNCTCHMLYRFIIVSIIFFLYVYPQYSYESQGNVTMGLHFSEYHSRILSQQLTNLRTIQLHNRRKFEELKDKYMNETKMVVMGMIFGMKSELMECPSLREYPNSLKFFLWLLWNDYVNLRMSYIETQDNRRFEELEKSKNPYDSFSEMYDNLMKKWVNLRLELSKNFVFFLRYAYVLLQYAYTFEGQTEYTINAENLLFEGVLGIPGAKFINRNKRMILLVKIVPDLAHDEMTKFGDKKVNRALNDLMGSISILEKS